jgi:hypothetical protein
MGTVTVAVGGVEGSRGRGRRGESWRGRGQHRARSWSAVCGRARSAADVVQFLPRQLPKIIVSSIAQGTRAAEQAAQRAAQRATVEKEPLPCGRAGAVKETCAADSHPRLGRRAHVRPSSRSQLHESNHERVCAGPCHWPRRPCLGNMTHHFVALLALTAIARQPAIHTAFSFRSASVRRLDVRTSRPSSSARYRRMTALGQHQAVSLTDAGGTDLSNFDYAARHSTRSLCRKPPQN